MDANELTRPSGSAREADLILRARWVLPISAPPIEHGEVAVRDGRILGVAHSGCDFRATEELDLGEAALLPGLVNVHTHLELTVLRGFCEHADFFRWIRRLTRTKYEDLTREDFEISARLGAIEAVRTGTTTVGDAGDQRVVAKALGESGLRGTAFQEVFGPAPEDCEPALRTLEEALAAQEGLTNDRVRLGVSPHAPYTVSAPLLEAVAGLAAQRDLPLTIHAGESRAEGDFLRHGTGPFAEHLRSRGITWEPPGVSPVAYLSRLGILDVRPLLVHVVDCDSSDVELLRRADAAVAHCPKSNAKLGHGVAPYAEWVEAGLRVGLGTDSAVSNNTLDLIDETRVASFFMRQRTRSKRPEGESYASRLLERMTLGGAEALGLSDEIGSLEVGKCADLVAIDLSHAATIPCYDPAAAIVMSACGRDAKLTVVGGQIVYDGERVRTLDEPGLLVAARRVAARLTRVSPGNA